MKKRQTDGRTDQHTHRDRDTETARDREQTDRPTDRHADRPMNRKKKYIICCSYKIFIHVNFRLRTNYT